MHFGIDRLINEPSQRAALTGKRVALVAHPGSVTATLEHSLDALAKLKDLKLSAAFSPQHGMRGEKQDNMVESTSYLDPRYGIPVHSLYGEVRRPTKEMMEDCDVVLFDLQDVGCRIYTYVSTLLYLMEACAETQKSLWVLDRPNPAGRALDGTYLRSGFESFVGVAPIPIRHGMTMGELAIWYKKHFHLPVDLHILSMEGYDPTVGPGFGWPLGEKSWVNPSPNAPNLSMVRCFAGSVMLEGTHLSEGRGTTRPLEVVGHPTVDMGAILKSMEKLNGDWLRGCLLRRCYFEPTFHKHQGQLCNGFQVHVDHAQYDPKAFKPFRLFALFFKALRGEYPDFEIWRDFHYEYEKDRLAIDLITGSSLLRDWVDDSEAHVQDLEILVEEDLSQWREELASVALYSLGS
jgi:uncharacterized protein YbbC (DUF1343 family)